MNISILIPTLNEEKNIGKVLKSLCNQLQKGDEIIIVDSYSEDRTIKIAKKFGAKVIFFKRCGVGPAKTFAANKSKNDILAFLDADGVVSPNWLSLIRKRFKESDVDSVAGLDLYEGRRRIDELIYNSYSLFVFELARLIYFLSGIPWFPSNNCAIKKNIFFKHGGFQNVVCEDLDLSVRTKGIKNVYEGRMKVILSDRRFRKEGFLRTVWMWVKSDIGIFLNKKIDIMKYSVVR